MRTQVRDWQIVKQLIVIWIVKHRDWLNYGFGELAFLSYVHFVHLAEIQNVRRVFWLSFGNMALRTETILEIQYEYIKVIYFVVNGCGEEIAESGEHTV